MPSIVFQFNIMKSFTIINWKGISPYGRNCRVLKSKLEISFRNSMLSIENGSVDFDIFVERSFAVR